MKDVSDAALMDFLAATLERIARLKARHPRTLNDHIALRYSQMEAERTEKELKRRRKQAQKG